MLNALRKYYWFLLTTLGFILLLPTFVPFLIYSIFSGVEEQPLWLIFLNGVVPFILCLFLVLIINYTSFGHFYIGTTAFEIEMAFLFATFAWAILGAISAYKLLKATRNEPIRGPAFATANEEYDRWILTTLLTVDNPPSSLSSGTWIYTLSIIPVGLAAGFIASFLQSPTYSFTCDAISSDTIKSNYLICNDEACCSPSSSHDGLMYSASQFIGLLAGNVWLGVTIAQCSAKFICDLKMDDSDQISLGSKILRFLMLIPPFLTNLVLFRRLPQ